MAKVAAVELAQEVAMKNRAQGIDARANSMPNVADIGSIESLNVAFAFISDVSTARKGEKGAVAQVGDWEGAQAADEAQKHYRYCHFLRAQEAIEPDSTLGFYCTITTMLLVLYSAFLIPARLGFRSENDAGPMSKFLDLFSEWWFVWDIVINLHLGFEDADTGQLILDLQTIRRVYTRSWLPIDAMSSIPFDSISVIMPALSQFSMMKMFRLCKLFRLIKLLKLKALEDLEDKGVISPTILRLSKISFVFGFLVHVVACAYWHVVLTTCKFCEASVYKAGSPDAYWMDCSETEHYGLASFATPAFCPSVYKVSAIDSPNSLIASVDGHIATLTEKYSAAFYWAVLAMLGDNAQPETKAQLLFSIFMSMIGIVVFSTVIGSLSAVLSNLDSGAAAKQDQLDSVNAYLSFRRVNPELKIRIRGFYKYLWHSGQSAHHQSMFDELPPTLSTQLMLQLKEELIVGVPMFHDASAKTMLELVKGMESCIAIPGEAVLKQGEKGDKMHFCLRGQLEVCLFVQSSQREERLNVLIQGAFFGESALFGAGENPATIRALKFTELEVLEIAHIRILVNEDANLRSAIKAEARKNFAMSAARRPRNLMGVKQEEEKVVDASKLARDLRKKYGNNAATDSDGKRTKRDVPVGLLAEMHEIFGREQRGLTPLTDDTRRLQGSAEYYARTRSSAHTRSTSPVIGSTSGKAIVPTR
jgi:CRP-like cAMP-binding protein